MPSHTDHQISGQLTDELYLRVFFTFINSNPALEQRADYYRTFVMNHDFSVLLGDEKDRPLQVLEIGSGTGMGSANNARILSEMFNSRVRYVAIDKRKQLVDMTQNNLLLALSGTQSYSDVFVQDGLHHITQIELNYFGFIGGKIDIYFAEHSTYSELYDFNKTLAYLNGLKNILKECALAFIVVQTEHAEIQRLVGRNVKSTLDYAQHIINFDKTIEMLGFKVLVKYLNPTRLRFPKLSQLEWKSIKTRVSDLSCFSSRNVEKTLELMTFIKKPLNCLNDTELGDYVDVLQDGLKRRNNTVSNDEYIYILSPMDCSAKTTVNESKQNSNSAVLVAAHGFLRGVSYCLSQKLISKGVSKQSSFLLGQCTYYSGFFAMKFASHYHAASNEESGLNSLCAAAIETGQLIFVSSALSLMDHALKRSAKMLDQRKKGSWLAKGVSFCRSLIPFSIFANNESIASATTAMAVGGAVEMVTRKSFG